VALGDINKEQQTPPPSDVTLAPGVSYSFPVTTLHGYGESNRYWLVAGEYTVRAEYSCFISPAPQGASKSYDNSGHISIWSAPLKIKVEESQK
jgi:hypothetical protein